MPTCTQITDALNVIASATSLPNPNILSDLSGQVAVTNVPISNENNLAIQVNLISGAQATLAPDPSLLDGKIFQIIVSGIAKATTVASANSVTVAIFQGTSISGINVVEGTISLGNISGYRSFSATANLLWDSHSQTLLVLSNNSVIQNISSSNLLFSMFTGMGDHETGELDPEDVLTITQFKLQLV